MASMIEKFGGARFSINEIEFRAIMTALGIPDYEHDKGNWYFQPVGEFFRRSMTGWLWVKPIATSNNADTSIRAIASVLGIKSEELISYEVVLIKIIPSTH